jgi:hypothetical protein
MLLLARLLMGRLGLGLAAAVLAVLAVWWIKAHNLLHRVAS